jgi:protein-S-isoprenylcysteine O-methyltransferase Ste14
MWLSIAVAIEGMALIGVLGVLTTRRTRVAFVSGFNTMALVTGILVAHAGLHPRGALVQYAVDAIPKNEKWAAARYGGAWEAYRTKTKVFVPYLI